MARTERILGHQPRNLARFVDEVFLTAAET